MSALGGPRDGGGPPARALLPALQTRATPRRCPRTSTVDHDQSPSTATARSLEYPSVTTDEAQLKIRASVPTGAASNTTREDADTPTTPTTGIHATDQLLVSTTPYYAHLYPLLLRARGALQDLDRTPQEPGHYDDDHDRHPRNGSAPCLDDALLRAPLPPSTSRERSTARLGPHPAGARSLRRLPRLTRKYWAAPYTSSLLPRSRARARCGLGAFAPGPAAHVLASR